MGRLVLTSDSECKYCKGKGTYMAEVYVPVESLSTGPNHIPRVRRVCACVKPVLTEKDLE